MVQSPMLSCPLKQTNEIDWVQPLKDHIRQAYGEDPERYNQECITLNRLRQDMRGAGKDSATGRDLLYRYYGQLELLDLRFPVDENHIRISFTWYDAFTHQPTSQYSLAYEKASIIFNISAVLSCHAANQNRADDTGIKTAYHSFQASAGMFTYINENFLHAPSTDLNRDTVKTLIHVTLAQAQEIIFEKQVAEQKKPAFLAKLAGQAAYLYSQGTETMQDFVGKNVFDKVWTTVVQAKAAHMKSVASYYQAIADSQNGAHGVAIARLQAAEKQAVTALTSAKAFPATAPASFNMTTESGAALMDLIKHNQASVKTQLATMVKDNDFIYHQPVPSEVDLSAVARLPAAKPIPISELYQGQDIQRIIGPDIFQKLVPMSVTETASLYDEEKAKLIRAENEKAETANDEMAASLDYLKLPGSLNILKGSMNKDKIGDETFSSWCADLSGKKLFHDILSDLEDRKSEVLAKLDTCSKKLDLEESVCEKMRSKYEADWTQQPSSRLNTTLRGDIRSYRDTVNEASASDSQLFSTQRQYESDFYEMRSAGENEEADMLFQQALDQTGSSQGKSKNGVTSPAEGSLLDDIYDEDGTSVAEKTSHVEEILKKLNLVKRERAQLLKDLKDKVHDDDISSVLILNKKSISGQESQLFQSELEKFRPHQNRLLQAAHKQQSLMKELTKVYSNLLQDKRVQAEQLKSESRTRQHNSVMARYKKVYEAYNGLSTGVNQARIFYRDMRSNVDSLCENVETFINDRRSEGAALLSQIERDKASGVSEQEDHEREKLRQLMERLSTESSPLTSPSITSGGARSKVKSPPPSVHAPKHGSTAPPQMSPRYPPSMPGHSLPHGQYMGPYHPAGQFQQGAAASLADGYNPMAYPSPASISPPPNQAYYSQPPAPYSGYSNYGTLPPGVAGPPSHYMGYVPPPPPPPSQTEYPPSTGAPYPSGPGGWAHSRPTGHRRTPSQHRQPAPPNPNDPWAGLNEWR